VQVLCVNTLDIIFLPSFKIAMAVIQKLRNSGMVVIVVVAALVLFVIGDLLNSRYGSNSNTAEEGVFAEIGGKSFKEKDDLEPLVNKLYQQKLAGDPSLANRNSV
jgi:hypothetical protein